MNERSAEYLLVSNLVATLSDEHARVVPVFFWKTREGGHAASEGMRGHEVRLLTLFARRPKVAGPQSPDVAMTVNAELFDASDVASTFNSPVLCGIPRVNTLLDLTLGAPCSWFWLQAGIGAAHAMQVFVPIDGSAPRGVALPIEGPLNEQQIRRIARAETIPMSWERAVEAMGAIRQSSTVGSWRFGGTGYRPFFALVIS
ncbi:MAG: hypothetical protein ACYCX5_12345 [Coriobacteriia bacterium]